MSGEETVSPAWGRVENQEDEKPLSQGSQGQGSQGSATSGEGYAVSEESIHHACEAGGGDCACKAHSGAGAGMQERSLEVSWEVFAKEEMSCSV